MKMKHILLPTDFSDNSINAIHYALKFFGSEETHFYLINIQKTSDYTTSDLMYRKPSSTLYEAILDDNQFKLKQLIQQLQKEFKSKKYTFKAIVDFDVFTDAIRQAIKTFQIDLIIMGTNGASGAKEKLFGSNTLQVIRQINCPLITVPENYQFSSITKVLFSTSTDSFSFDKVNPLIDIILSHKASLLVLKMDDSTTTREASDQKNSLERLKEVIDYTFYTLTGISRPTGIDAFEQLHPIDLHAFFTKKESFLDRIIFGSETSDISYGSKVPLLIMHND